MAGNLASVYRSKGSLPIQGVRAGSATHELVRGGITEVFPTLQNVFLVGFTPYEPLRKVIGQFVTARQLSSHPIAVTTNYSLSQCSIWDISYITFVLP